MTSATHQISRTTRSMVCVVLSGAFDDHAISSCACELRSVLTLAPALSLAAIVDLRGVTEYSLDARHALEKLQGFLATKARRVAYVADTARTRGLALWLAHNIHANACVVDVLSTLDDAERFTSSNDPQRASFRPPARSSAPEPMPLKESA